MIDHAAIARLIPHQGAMCLLDRVARWSATGILCRARSHLAPDNPLRRDGRLATICGCEYAFQAAALHGALLAGGVAQPAGYLAALRHATIAVRHLDDPRLGELHVEATQEFAEPAGLIYSFRLTAENGDLLLDGRATIKLPTSAA